jgi:spondin N/type IX secretion system substrate protein
MFRFYLSFLTFILFGGFSIAQDAIYTLDFNSNWTSDNHPTDYPPAAHWSSLIGTTHNNSVSLWAIGQLASQGVEDVAEDGLTANLTQEINTMVSNGNAYEVIELPLGFGLNFSFETINVDANFPYISLMTMVAPSPDWLAQINSVKLTDASGNWLPNITINVYATDSGTDDGTTYIFPNTDTNPPEPISSLENTLPFSNKIVASFVFVLDQVLSVNDVGLQKSISIYPNPSNGEIFINNSKKGNIETVEIIDVTGKKLKEIHNVTNNKAIRFNSLKSGFYFIKINSASRSIVKKMIIE